MNSLRTQEWPQKDTVKQKRDIVLVEACIHWFKPSQPGVMADNAPSAADDGKGKRKKWVPTSLCLGQGQVGIEKDVSCILRPPVGVLLVMFRMIARFRVVRI